MKKTIMLTFAAIACLCACISCSGDETLENISSTESEVTSRSSSNEELQFIDFVDDENFDSQTIVIEVAAERLDKYVSFTGERYVMAPCTPQEVGLSQRVFDYMQGCMEKQNERVDTFKDWISIDGKSFIYSEIQYLPPRISTRSETGQPGGVTALKVREDWIGTHVDIYISNDDLQNTILTLGFIEGVAFLIPNPLAKTAVQAICNLAGIGVAALAKNYPNGIIISIIMPKEGSGCAPYSLKGQ